MLTAKSQAWRVPWDWARFIPLGRFGIPVVLGVALSSCSTLSDMRNPDVVVDIDHPPGIGVYVARVGFAPSDGFCSRVLEDRLKRTLRSRGVAVDAIAETLNVEAPVGETEPSIRSGEIVVALKDRLCEAERSSDSQEKRKTRRTTRTGADGKEEEYEEVYRVTEYTGTTRFELRVSARVSDRLTGEVVGVLTPEAYESDKETGLFLHYPSAEPLVESALERAHEELSQWLSPWAESVKLVFYDAEECGMNATHAHLSAGDGPLALEAAERSIALCEQQEHSFRAAAAYNAGMVHFMQGDHGAALRMLDAAAEFDSENVHVRKAARTASRAIELRGIIEQMQKDAALHAERVAKQLEEKPAGSSSEVETPSETASRGSARGGGTKASATITESEGPTKGSLVTLRFDAGSAVPSVGASGTLSVPVAMPLFGGAGSMSLLIGAGECEVIKADGDTVVVRITEPGGTITDKASGEVRYTLPGVGSEVFLEPI